MYLLEAHDGIFHVQARADTGVRHHAGVVDDGGAVHLRVVLQRTAASDQAIAMHGAAIPMKAGSHDACEPMNSGSSADPDSGTQLTAARTDFACAGKSIQREAAQMSRRRQQIYIAAGLVRKPRCAARTVLRATELQPRIGCRRRSQKYPAPLRATNRPASRKLSSAGARSPWPQIQLCPRAQAKHQDAIGIPSQPAELLRGFFPEVFRAGHDESAGEGEEWGRGSVSLKTATSPRPRPRCGRAYA